MCCFRVAVWEWLLRVATRADTCVFVSGIWSIDVADMYPSADVRIPPLDDDGEATVVELTW